MNTPSEALAAVERAGAEGRLSQGAVDNLRAWLTQPRYAAFLPAVLSHVDEGRWQDLDDAFWTVIPFGTGGRRGRMYPIGSNTINDRTIGESVQGLADYARKAGWSPLACAIAYDTRHRSAHFARLSAEIMAGNGFRVSFLEGHRSTPELSFAVRHCGCACGIMVSASHNPPSDNAVKVYGPTGGQLLTPHDAGLTACVMGVDAIRRESWDAALATGQIVCCQDEVDRAYQAAVLEQAEPGPRTLQVLYSPLHGVGATAVVPVLRAAGFQPQVYGPHASCDPDFPNVPGHVSNPENPAVFDGPIAAAREAGADLVLATDPDCDRLGVAAPLTLDAGAPWATLSGNQLGALLADHLLARAQRSPAVGVRPYLVKTLVTTEMMRRIADSYGAETVGDLLVGFKYIGGVLDQRGPAGFILGAEESYGFLIGAHARDKDGAAAALAVCQLAARVRAEGRSLHEQLDALFLRHGLHTERQFSLTLPGSSGMERMQKLMADLRRQPPPTLGGLPVAGVRDYLDGQRQPRGDLLFFDLHPAGNSVAVRPSGTEPKVKFYLFAYLPPHEITALEADKRRQAVVFGQIEADLRNAVG